MASVHFHNVSKTYPTGQRAVAGLNLEVNNGEFVVLVGPSGCGKTTTLRMLAGLEDVTEGDIRIGDRSVVNVPPGKRDIAMVFQDYALYPHMTVRKNLSFGLRMRRTPKPEIRQRVQRVAEMLDIASLLDRRPRELSGGQRQRVALGRAIVRQPQVFLFDEPLSNLDAKLRVQTRSELATLHRSLAATMIYVTHDQVEAMTLADRMVLMDAGRVQQIAPPLTVYEQPANRFVAAFVGNPPMNLIEGAIADGAFLWPLADGQRHAVPLPGMPPSGPATIGLRPEDLQPGESELALPSGRVTTTEHLGHEIQLHVAIGQATVIARLPPNRAIANSGSVTDITLTAPPDRLHLFDATGNRMGRS